MNYCSIYSAIENELYQSRSRATLGKCHSPYLHAFLEKINKGMIVLIAANHF